MLEQVSGRAGRGTGNGRVVIQTSDPEHPVFHYLVSHDYVALYHEQIDERRAYRYPPFFRMLTIVVRGRDADITEHAAAELADRLAGVFSFRCSRVVTPPINRINALYVRHIVLRIEANADIMRAEQLVMQQITYIHQLPHYKGVTIYADID